MDQDGSGKGLALTGRNPVECEIGRKRTRARVCLDYTTDWHGRLPKASRELGFSVPLPILLDLLRHARSCVRKPFRLSFAQIFLNVVYLAAGAKMDVGRF